jgi:pyridoxamine 5'-phosphate oxidase
MTEWNHRELERVRREYELDKLDEARLPEDPLSFFVLWLDEAVQSGLTDPTAMTLSTVDAGGVPSSRIVLLKRIEKDRLIFYSNYRSKKARDIGQRPEVAVLFHWPRLERQVKISGKAGKLEPSESDLYFSSRPFESRVAAWASPQSEVVPGREYLENAYRAYLEKFAGSEEVPRPEYWGGYYISPVRIEFWQGGRFRMHDRIEYSLKDGRWSRVRLAP